MIQFCFSDGLKLNHQPANYLSRLHCPKQSMYGISPYIYHKNQPNVGKYTIHGWYGCGKPMQLGMSSCNVSQVLRSTHILLQIGGPPWSFWGEIVAKKCHGKSRGSSEMWQKKPRDQKRVKQYKPRYIVYIRLLFAHIFM